MTETPAQTTAPAWLDDFAAGIGVGMIAGIIFALCFLVPWDRL